jgi:hypothetical protein
MTDVDKLLANEKAIENKKVSQIIGFLGDGKLKNDDNSFRQFLKEVSNEYLIKYAEECLDKGFQDSGLALQDIVNEIGRRLGFEVTNGLYRGNKNEIGFDGIWKQYDGWNLIVEVKTTDAYRISLDVIANYRTKLIAENKIEQDKSSMLIIVGRNDTGELEAQIRGSKHAWDIRILSTDSLIRLLRIKESLSDESTAQKISIALRPYEFTRVDQLIELLFLAIKDVEVEEKADDFIDEPKSISNTKGEKEKKFTPVSFHEPVFEKVKLYLKNTFIKKSKSSYSSTDGKIGLTISISKQHPAFNSQFDSRYWFAFHPHQDLFLQKHEIGYACYGYGNENNIYIIPYKYLQQKLPYMWETKSTDREYKHIVIYRKDDKCYLRTNIDEKEHYDDLSEFKI